MISLENSIRITKLAKITGLIKGDMMAQKVKLEDKSQYICEKAYEEFVKTGVRNFSLNKLIESLNMSKGQFYYYFKTKEALIYEVITRKSLVILEDTSNHIKSEMTFFGKLSAFFSCYMDSSNPVYSELDKIMRDTFFLYINVENEYIKQMNLDFYNMTYDYIEAIFEEMIHNGYLKNESKQWIKSLIATADGMYFHSMIKDDYDLKTSLLEYLMLVDQQLKK